jgi:hypothetical protein
LFAFRKVGNEIGGWVDTDSFLLLDRREKTIVESGSFMRSKLFRNCGREKKTPWSESASELHRPSDRRLSTKWLPTFADRGCHVVRVTDPYGRILEFIDRGRYFSIK